MDMERTPHPECAVSGILSFVLRWSRVAGLAPLHFRSTRGSWRIQVAHSYSFYGKLLAVLFGTTLAILLVIDMSLYKDSSLNGKTNANQIVWIVDVLIVSTLGTTGAYTGVSRMRSMIDCIEELDQLKEELKRFRQPTRVNDRKELIVLSSIIFCVILNVTDYLYFVYRAVLDNGTVVITSLYIFLYIPLINFNLLLNQFLLIVMMILATVKELNNCLSDVLVDLQKNKSLVSSLTTLYIKTVHNNDERVIKSNQVAQKQFYDASIKIFEDIKSVPTRLNCLIRIYTILCDVIQRIERSHETLLVIVTLSFTLTLIITPYHLMCGISMLFINFFFVYPEHTDHANTLLQVPWLLHLLVKMAMVVEPCHRTHDQLDKTKDLFAQMTRYINDDDYAVVTEIKTFFRHYTLYRCRYSPMQFFTLNRPIVVTMCGSILTYLIIVIQMTKYE